MSTSTVIAPSVQIQQQKKPFTIPLHYNLLISGFSGCFAWLFTHPFELVKNKVILAPLDQPLGSLFKETWAVGPFKGLSGGLARQVVYTTCRLGLYDPVKTLVVRGDEPTVIERALAGAIAGSLASFMGSPVEVCLVQQTKAKAKLSLLKAGVDTFADGGITAFWRGAIPLMIRASIVGISQVAMYDQVKSMITKWSDSKPKEARWTSNGIFIGASSITGLFYSFVTMPIEISRVKMSAFKSAAVEGAVAKKPPGMVKILSDVVKNDGIMSIFRSFLPYYLRCATHTTVAFFVIESINPRAKKYLAPKN